MVVYEVPTNNRLCTQVTTAPQALLAENIKVIHLIVYPFDDRACALAFLDNVERAHLCSPKAGYVQLAVEMSKLLNVKYIAGPTEQSIIHVDKTL